MQRQNETTLRFQSLILVTPIHARNLFEFFCRTTSGKDNYAFAQAYVPEFDAFQDPQVRARKDALYQKICAPDAQPALSSTGKAFYA
jgi:hypothetical protein